MGKEYALMGPRIKSLPGQSSDPFDSVSPGRVLISEALMVCA